MGPKVAVVVRPKRLVKPQGPGVHFGVNKAKYRQVFAYCDGFSDIPEYLQWVKLSTVPPYTERRSGYRKQLTPEYFGNTSEARYKCP